MLAQSFVAVRGLSASPRGRGGTYNSVSSFALIAMVREGEGTGAVRGQKQGPLDTPQ
jgi:hypothetical protein